MHKTLVDPLLLQLRPIYAAARHLIFYYSSGVQKACPVYLKMD